MKALRLDCVRINDTQSQGDNGMSVYENQGDIVFCANSGYFEKEDDTSVYLDRESVKELVVYLSDWLARNPF